MRCWRGMLHFFGVLKLDGLNEYIHYFNNLQMRSDKPKLSLPPKLKTIPRGLRSPQFTSSEHSEKANLNDCDPIFMNKSSSAFDQTSFKTKYERALDLIATSKENDSRNALNILQCLCSEIQHLPEENELSYQLLENVVINCWRLKNTLRDDYKRQDSLNFIRNYVQLFADIYKRNQIRKNGLHMMYLIQANQQFDEKLFNDALKSCEMSIKHCSGIKNQAHLLKVQYLKCSIHNSLNNSREELESIKRCLFFINSLIATTTEESLKEYINQLKKSLVSREAYLKENPNQQKSVDISKKTSFSVFRRRSLSHKKQSSQNEIIIEKKPELNSLKNSKRVLAKSIHARSVSGSKHTIVLKEQKPSFLPVDLTRFNKPEAKLKKKTLKITDKNRLYDNSEKRGNPMDDIQEIGPVSFNYQLLMVRRPNQVKKQSLKKSNKKPEIEEIHNQEISMQEIMSKKESAQQQQQKIEPVTHYISKNSHPGNDEIVEQQQEELIRECVRSSEEALLKTFFKKMALDEENQFNGKTVLNISNHLSRLDSSSSSSYSSSNQYKPRAEELPELNLSRSETNNHYQYFEPEVDCDSNFNINQNLQLVTYMGILSKFKFTIKIQKKERMDESEQLYKEMFIKFSTILNRQHNLHSVLSFRYYNPFEKNLEIIMDEIFEKELQGKYFIGQSMKHKLLSMISNRLFFIKKPNGITLVQKEERLFKQNSIIDQYNEYLKSKFIIYQQNKLTNFDKNIQSTPTDIIARKNKENLVQIQIEEKPKEKQEDLNGYHQILNFYLPQLIRRMTDDFRQDKSSLSSVKRMKTERFYKDTILSYRSLIKSLNQSDTNARVMFDDQRSLSIVMPSDFNSKISNFFEHEEGVKETSIYQFYYCMKFILIQPAKSDSFGLSSQLMVSQKKERRITIDKCIKQADNEPDLVVPRHLEDTLSNFYDYLEIQHMFHLDSKQQVHIKMTCYKVKEIFKKTEEYFYKFQMQFNREKIKMMKFISTSYDIYLLVNRRAYQLKSSRKKEKAMKEDYEIPAFNKPSLLNLLKEISKRIFVKKDYIYSIIGLQTPNSHFSYINKFRLQGKTVQNKQFMIPHLKCIHILLQKSIKIICDHFRQYSVLTIRQIERSIEFNIIFYVPKYQRTYSINLSRHIIDYLQPEHKQTIFQDEQIPNNQEIMKLLFKSYDDASQPYQTRLWNNFSKLFKFEVQYYEDKMHLLLRIGNFVAFLKDSCFSQFFELKDKIFHLEMSLARKSSLNASESQLSNLRNMHPKRKSASSKQLIKRNNFVVTKDMKSSGRPLKPSIQKKISKDEELFKKGDPFEKLSKIYETETDKYIIYLSLTKMYEISDQENNDQQQTKKVNFSFYLSDMINLLNESKKELYTREEKYVNEFNEEIFSFSILLRSMTIIKYKLINQLKSFKEIDQIFEGDQTIRIQKQFKNNLIKAFCSQNDNLYSLNASKKLYKLDNNIFLINKKLMSGKKNAIVSIFYDQKGKKITFYLTNISDLVNKHKIYAIKEMKFPWIEFYQKEQLFNISTRMYNYYKNILLFT